MKLHVLKKIPEALFSCQPNEVYKEVGGPLLLELGNQSQSPLFVSTLLHGNETTGFYALQKVFAEYLRHPERFSRPLLVLLGDVKAASKGVRHLEGQQDFNRIWSGGTSPKQQWAQEILHFLESRHLFAGLDIHNNTGLNPLYGCVNYLDNRLIHMASLFSPHIVFFQKPDGVLSKEMAKFAPAITIECGLPGLPEGIKKVYDYILTLLHLETIQEFHPRTQGINVYHSESRILLPSQFTLAREEDTNASQADLMLPRDFDQWNFSELNSKTPILKRNNPNAYVIVQNEEGQHVQNKLLKAKGSEILIKKSTIPSMFTRDLTIAKSDCLGYLMSRIM